MNILLTGITGNLGPGVAASLAPHRILALTRPGSTVPAGMESIEGTLANLPAHLAPEIDAILHCAALTAFRADPGDLRDANVRGVESLIAFAHTCPRLSRFIHFSTTCVWGDATGFIPETPIPARPHFVNPYEETKWEAEQLILASSLPAEILRLSVVAGSALDGSVRRVGALHHTLFWLFKGLIPVMPGLPGSRVDIISTEFASAAFAALWNSHPLPGRIAHASAGDQAPLLADLLSHLRDIFAAHQPAWARGTILLPDIVDAETFALFEASVRQSGDLLFRKVCDSANSFLPGLLYPRTFASSLTAAISDWRPLTDRIFQWLLATDWGRSPIPSYAST